MLSPPAITAGQPATVHVFGPGARAKAEEQPLPELASELRAGARARRAPGA